MKEEYTGPGCYAFTFVVVMEGESMADALEQAHDYLSNQQNKPTEIECLSVHNEEVKE